MLLSSKVYPACDSKSANNCSTSGQTNNLEDKNNLWMMPSTPIFKLLIIGQNKRSSSRHFNMAACLKMVLPQYFDTRYGRDSEHFFTLAAPLEWKRAGGGISSEWKYVTRWMNEIGCCKNTDACHYSIRDVISINQRHVDLRRLIGVFPDLCFASFEWCDACVASGLPPPARRGSTCYCKVGVTSPRASHKVLLWHFCSAAAGSCLQFCMTALGERREKLRGSFFPPSSAIRTSCIDYY